MSDSDVYVVYDGDCPFCSSYVKMVRLREAAGRVHLINARDDHPVVREIIGAGLDLDEGMVLKMNGRLYHGDECMNRIALLSTSSGLFNKVNHAVFRHARLAKVLYPILRAGRNATLAVLGFEKIAAKEKA